MYLLDNWHKFVIAGVLLAIYGLGTSFMLQQNATNKAEQSLAQLSSDDQGQARSVAMNNHVLENNGYAIGWCVMGLLVFMIFIGDLKRFFSPKVMVVPLLFMSLFSTGCYRPFEPVKLEAISSNEEAFLLPYLGDAKKQTASDNEEYLRENLIYGKQIKIPQQWVPKGYEYVMPNGEWRDAAILIKVDKSPVTREWTADPNSGTSNKQEAVWCMTSDQIEFSTGWTITARIASREDAIKFLHNYPNGSLEKVLDSEVRAKLQAVFGLEVTDLPMDTLRKAATPHIIKVKTEVEAFFIERGISITNLGITGGIVYKDKSVMDTMIKVFNAEQEKSITAAKNAAQEETNKMQLSISLTEATSIKSVADAKFYEIEKAAESLDAYVTLKQLELQKEMLAKWDGTYPKYFMSNGGSSHPNMLLQLPSMIDDKK